VIFDKKDLDLWFLAVVTVALALSQLQNAIVTSNSTMLQFLVLQKIKTG